MILIPLQISLMIRKDDLLKIGYAYWRQHSSFEGSVPSVDYALAPEHPSTFINSKEKLESHEIYLYGRKKNWQACFRFRNANSLYP